MVRNTLLELGQIRQLQRKSGIFIFCDFSKPKNTFQKILQNLCPWRLWMTLSATLKFDPSAPVWRLVQVSYIWCKGFSVISRKFRDFGFFFCCSSRNLRRQRCELVHVGFRGLRRFVLTVGAVQTMKRWPRSRLTLTFVANLLHIALLSPLPTYCALPFQTMRSAERAWHSCNAWDWLHFLCLFCWNRFSYIHIATLSLVRTVSNNWHCSGSRGWPAPSLERTKLCSIILFILSCLGYRLVLTQTTDSNCHYWLLDCLLRRACCAFASEDWRSSRCSLFPDIAKTDCDKRRGVCKQMGSGSNGEPRTCQHGIYKDGSGCHSQGCGALSGKLIDDFGHFTILNGFELCYLVVLKVVPQVKQKFGVVVLAPWQVAQSAI